ncbi:MAG: Transketolase [Hydrogenibacillus schlegelii]|uniref:Transketolase n=1 Tax=Hydrogenibacillus schlegelii TaxID=1484 RepID=A0A2T5GFP4_HYDSH|nr:transketolase [Hydrogenibacillus schlegelii]PTQ55003.1 MAG: Transketolase [Hydrogenibacillus schlegelii]
MGEAEARAIAAIRALAIDAIERAQSGHPGLPMGAAPMAYVLWTRHLVHNPKNPAWPDRDRFILSAGHGSMLLYALLHLTGYDVSLDDLKAFRQWGSKTPGHPEYGHTPGVEATTGPLGQGIAMAVGMAMAERHLAARFNRPGFPIVDHYTYTLVGDGDLMEGVAAEAASLAGHLKLGRLIALYDSNDVSLDGSTDKAFTEDVALRFRAYGWQVLRVDDGHDLEAIDRAIAAAKAEAERPSLIIVRTVIGYGSAKAGTSAVHGAPLGPEDAARAKAAYGWSHPPFDVPDDVRAHFAEVARRGEAAEAKWRGLFERYRAEHPALADAFLAALERKLPDDLAAALPTFAPGEKKIATRDASGTVLNALAQAIPTLIGGSADLASSNKTTLKGEADFGPPDYAGRNIWFGVREHAMGAILNGMALHGGLVVYGGTFFVFSDYLRPAMRLSALMGVPVLYVLTHDSIAVGEDGPTHQPIEHLASLRAMPNLFVFRPADANETAAAYAAALAAPKTPSALVLSRQGLPVLPETAERAMEGVRRGGYVLYEAGFRRDRPRVIFIATGSEVALARQAAERLFGEGVGVRVVSLPCWELFEAQPDDYRRAVLPPEVRARVTVEMASPFGWERYAGEAGVIVGIDRFGASAPGEVLVERFGFTAERLVAAAREALRRAGEAVGMSAGDDRGA